MTTELIPPDTSRCQAERPNGEGPFTLGGGHKMIRCKAKPTWLATENKPGPDGLIGSMTLCDDCKAVFLKQLGEDYATLISIQ